MTNQANELPAVLGGIYPDHLGSKDDRKKIVIEA